MKTKAENRLANEKESSGKETEVFTTVIYLNIVHYSDIFTSFKFKLFRMHYKNSST